MNSKMKNVIYMHQEMFILISLHTVKAEILLKLVLNTNQSINQQIRISFWLDQTAKDQTYSIGGNILPLLLEMKN